MKQSAEDDTKNNILAFMLYALLRKNSVEQLLPFIAIVTKYEMSFIYRVITLHNIVD